MKKIILFFLTLFLSTSVGAQTHAEVLVSPNVLNLGELFQYQITLNFPDKYELIKIPTEEDFKTIKGIELEELKSDKSNEDGVRKIKLDYFFHLFSVGESIIPTQSIILKDKVSGQYGKIEVPPQKMNVLSTLIQSDNQDIVIRDSFYVEPLEWKPYVMMIVALLIGLILIGLIIRKLIKLRQSTSERKVEIPQDKRSYEEIALSSLKELYDKDYYQEGAYTYHYVCFSEILKRYLGQLYNEHIVEMTTEETMSYCKKKVTKDHLDEIMELLRFSDLIKFARFIPSLSDHQQVSQKMEKLIKELWQSYIKRHKPVEEVAS